MADLPTLEKALRNADAAGDTEAAKTFAREIQKMRGASVATPTAPEAMTDREAWESSFPVRMLRGVEAPAITLMKMVGPESIKQQLMEIDQLRESGMKKRGNEGFDWAGLIGSLAPGTAIAKGVTGALPAATSVLGKIGTGATVGAITSGMQPLQGKEELSPEKLDQIATGAVLGGAIPAGIEAVKGISGVVKRGVEPLYEQGRANILRRFQESKLPEGGKRVVIDALNRAKELVPGSRPTAGEVLSNTPEAAALAAHQKSISTLPNVSHEFVKHEAGQEAARLAALKPIAGTADDLAAAVKSRQIATDPLRDAALGRANEAGKQLPGLERTIAKSEKGIEKAAKQLSKLGPRQPKVNEDALRSAVDIHGVPPKPLLSQKEVLLSQLLPEQIASKKGEIEAAREAIGALEQAGMKPLTSSNLMRGLRERLSAPEIRASDVASKTLAHLEDKLTNLKNRRGTIDAFDLYMVRKELGNNIEKFSKESNTFDKKFTSKLLRDTQLAIDDAIEKAGGKGWREYLTKYQELSKPINRMEAGQKLIEALRNPLDTAERKQVFANAAADVDPRALREVDQRAVQSIVDDLARRDAFERLARKTNMAGQDAIPGQITPHLPNLLSRPAMVANAVMKFIGESGEEKIAKLASEQYRNPKKLAQALSKKDSEAYRKILDAMMTHTPGMAGTVAGRNY